PCASAWFASHRAQSAHLARATLEVCLPSVRRERVELPHPSGGAMPRLLCMLLSLLIASAAAAVAIGTAIDGLCQGLESVSFSILLRCFDFPGEWGDRMRDGLSILMIHPRGQTASRHAYRP